MKEFVELPLGTGINATVKVSDVVAVSDDRGTKALVYCSGGHVLSVFLDYRDTLGKIWDL